MPLRRWGCREEMAVCQPGSTFSPGVAYDTVFSLAFVRTWACTLGPQPVHWIRPCLLQLPLGQRVNKQSMLWLDDSHYMGLAYSTLLSSIVWWMKSHDVKFLGATRKLQKSDFLFPLGIWPETSQELHMEIGTETRAAIWRDSPTFLMVVL